MKQKVFTLMALLMSFFTTSWAADAKTVDDLTAITAPTIIKMEGVNGTSALTAGTLYADGKLLSMGNGNGWSTSKGSTTYNSVEYKNVYQIKTNRQMAIKLGFNAKITVVGEKKSGRKWQIGTTDGGKEVAEGADNADIVTGMVTASASAPKVVYITASSDLYIGAIVIEEANPVLTVKVNPSLLPVDGGVKEGQVFEINTLNEGDDLQTAIDGVWNAGAADYYAPDAKYDLVWDAMPEDGKMPATDLTLNGVYVPKVYKLNYKYAFGGTEPDQIKIDNVEYAYGATLPTQATPNIPGYTWDGQFFVNGNPEVAFPETMPAANTNVVANLQADGLSIYYYVDGQLVNTVNPITVNSSIPDYAPESEREFSGWKWYDADNKEIVKPSKMPAYSLTAVGHLKYNVNFTADAKPYAEASFFSGEKVALPTTQPTKEGYDFAGWANIPAAGTMPANDLEVSAEFIVNKYKISYQLDGKAYGETTEQYYGTTITPKDAPVMPEGYSFSGWKLADGSNVPAKVPAKDITIVGTTYNVYTLTFKVDGKEYDKQELKYDAKIVIPDAPKSPEGREFSGWGTVPAKMPKGNLTIEAGYKYLLTYNKHKLDNVTGEPTDEIIKHESVEYFYGDAIQPVVDNDDPEKYESRDADWATKYTFKWADMPKDGKMVAKDLTVLATYSAKNYKIQYKVDGANYGDPVEVPFGSLVSWKEEPTKENATFTGWMINIAGQDKFVTELLGYTMPNENIVVFGNFGDTKTMTYMAEDGKKNLNMESKFAANQPVKYNDIPAKEGYYGKWLLAKLKSGKKDEYESTGKIVKTQNPDEATLVVDEKFETDTVVMVKYDIRQFNITYIKDDNEGTAQTVTKDFNKDVDAAPAPAGSEWVYFKVNEDGSLGDEISKPSKYPAYDIKAYSYTQYTIHYFVNGEPYQTRKYYYKDVIADYTVLPNIDEAGPEIEGYQFNGWNYADVMPESSLTKDEDGNIIKVTMPESDVDVNAQLAKFYTVKYIVNGAEWTEKTAQFAEGDTYIVADVEEGYTLVDGEWTDELGTNPVSPLTPAVMPNTDVTYYGAVTTNVYTLVFLDADGNNFTEPQEVKFGDAIVAPGLTPEKRGYTFEKWVINTFDPTTLEPVELDLPETMPAYDLYVQPKYTANEYTLTLMLDGKVWKQLQVATDTNLDDVLALDENNPEKDEKLIAEGYTFYGWDVYNEAMPAQNYVIKGTGAQATGINGVAADDPFSDVVAWYTAEGKLLAAPVKGAMNIAKMSDGSMKKIMVK